MPAVTAAELGVDLVRADRSAARWALLHGELSQIARLNQPSDSCRGYGSGWGAACRSRSRRAAPRQLTETAAAQSEPSAMRRMSTTLVLSTVLSSALVALPTVTIPASAASAAPVAPRVHALPLIGVDAAELAASPAPEEQVRASAAERATSVAPAWRPVVVTGRVQSTPFSALGVSWLSDPQVDVAVQVRTRSGGRWSDWTEVDVQANSTGDDSPEARASRAGSDPLYVGPSDGVQVRVDAGATTPRDLQLALIDPGTSPADANPGAGPRTLGGAVANAAEPQPSYVSRAGWGADESLRSCTPNESSTIKGGILHTTATGNDYTASQSAAIMRSMYAYHTRTLG